MAEKKKLYTLAPDEKATPAMVYTMTTLAWGDVITKEMVRVSTYLRTIAPEYVSLHEARALPVRGASPIQPLAFTQLHVRTPHVIAFHLLPPANEPPDYDPGEENRKMEPVSVLIGPFRFDGLIRTSTRTDLATFLEISTEVFLSLYEVEISQPGVPSLGVVRAPMSLIRRDVSLFAPRIT